MTERSVAADVSARGSVRGAGQGVAVVLHPSLGRPASDFDALAERLVEASFRVLGIDPQGVGGDAPPDTNDLTLHDLADDVLGVLDEAGLATVHLVGHALGNRVVRCLAADHPDRVRSLTLLAAGGRVEGDDEARSALISCFDDQSPDDLRLDAVRTAFFAPGNDVPSSWRTGWYPAAAALQSAAVRRTPTEDWWSAGQAPMLVVQGLQDRVAPPENGRTLRDQRPSTTLVEIDGAGHALLPERPDAVAEAVLGFLRTV
ncbi:MAG: alpha/beta hydrolase [Actinomycetota bacterium]|nr:alpha/beta hydrolase [Actinomycetota bacterium]